MRKLRLISLAYLVVFGTSCVMLCSEAAAAAPDVLGKHKSAIQKTDWMPAIGTWYGGPNGDGSDVFGTSCVMLCSEAAAAAPDVLGKHKSAIQKTDWMPAIGTWYGGPNGDGSDGGACGYGSHVKQIPFQSKVSAVSTDLFTGGESCGACYQVKCTSNSLCSAKPVTVVITDKCEGGPCTIGETHFDLSGTAFGDMASDPSKAGQLRNVGDVALSVRRYPGMKITFQINEGANPYWFAFLVEYEDGDGDLAAVDLKQANSNSWQEMHNSWGAVWDLKSSQPLRAPFSIRLTTFYTGQTLTADNVIPQNWQPGATYRSVVNFV